MHNLIVLAEFLVFYIIPVRCFKVTARQKKAKCLLFALMPSVAPVIQTD